MLPLLLKKIIKERLIDSYGYNLKYDEYLDNILIDINSFDDYNILSTYIVKNYNKLIIE